MSKVKKSSDIKKKEVEKVNVKEILKKDDEPSWYHYIIVLVIIAGVLALPYFAYQFFVDDNAIVGVNESGIVLYQYPYKVGNVTYNLYLESTINELKNNSMNISIDKYDILNTIDFKMSFLNYNGTDNGYVAKGSTKLTSFLKLVYAFQFDKGDFTTFNETNCSSSTINSKVIYFNPYSNRTGVFMSENGCIQFATKNATDMVELVDKFIYEMVDLKDE